MDDIKIVRVWPGDVGFLQQIARATFIEAFSESNTAENMRKYLEEKLSLETLSAELANNDSEFYFAKSGEHIIGYLKLNRGAAQTELQDEHSLEVERIYVLKEYYGKLVGQLLFEKALTRAKEWHAAYLWLAVWEENPRAISFYRKNGFVEFGKHIFKLGDDEQTDLMMRLKL